MMHRPATVLGLLLALAAAPNVAVAQPAPCAQLSLYCIEMVPTAAYEGARATAILNRPSTAFGIAVTRDGRQRYRIDLDVAGLPAAPDGMAYVLWSMPLTLNPVTPMAIVGNGAMTAGDVSLNKFMLLVSLESLPSAGLAGLTERTGPLVLRGRSPSARMEPHDLFQVSAFADPAAGHAGHNTTWPAPPMHPVARMSDAMHTLLPDVNPWKPDNRLLSWAAVERVSDLPAARPRQVLTPEDGDAVELRAHAIRKIVGGQEMAFMGYNGQIPGPMILVEKNVTIEVTFINDTPFASSIHWHGLRHDNKFDGVPGLTQDPVPPGGTFTYLVHFPDAGMYWYHPHHREDIQQELGLYGNMMVLPAGGFTGTNQEILVLDDLAMTPDGVVPFGVEASTHMFMGRFGTVPLVNGEERVELSARPGDPVVLYVTNVSNTRTWNMSVDGHTLFVNGSDLGSFPQPVPEESMAIAPAERYTATLIPGAPGRYAIVNRIQSIDHTTGVFFPEVDTLGWMTVKGPPAPASAKARLAVAAGPPIDADRVLSAAPPPTREVELIMRTQDVPPLVAWILKADQSYFNPVEWSDTMPMMNWSATANQVDWVIREPSTGRENMDIEWRFDRGSTEVIRITNRRDAPHAMQHPVHLHGQRFRVLSYNGQSVTHQVWKDTVLIPAGMTVDIEVEFTNPGHWMMHCHIAEHLEGGMKLSFIVD